MRGDDISQEPPAGLPDGALWRRSQMVDMTLDEVERTLDLAGFADGRLDPDDRERVAEWLADDPIAAGDVAAARALGTGAEPEAMPEAQVARAALLIRGGDQPPGSNVVPFTPRRNASPRFYSAARWSSLVAAMAVASWLGFTLGMDTSLAVAQTRQAGDTGFLYELLNPSAGFMGDLTEGAQT